MTLGGVDDWLKSELRRAERQGLLQGRHLSLVQFNATIILNYLDADEKTSRHHDELNKALLATGNYPPHKLFPQDFAEPEGSTPPEDGSLGDNPDYKGVDWMGPSDSIEEFDRIMAEVAKLQSGKVMGDGFVERGPDEGWK